MSTIALANGKGFSQDLFVSDSVSKGTRVPFASVKKQVLEQALLRCPLYSVTGWQSKSIKQKTLYGSAAMVFQLLRADRSEYLANGPRSWRSDVLGLRVKCIFQRPALLLSCEDGT